ncbi:ATP-binding cassette domain-containing protein [Jonesiaceae bacterium BS-20]|uniref:ATP-binding cassette domain-containing protein n=1 Tax=Jonesiaceae bacterium BS-20 TaxID=3120821 RepID=A0AAU7DWK7_9MICO
MSRLEFVNLSKNYGDLQALNNLSFSVDSGEIFGFVGSNGAGKSTAMRIALGVLEPTSGQVTWDGVPLNFDIRTGIGYMPEERGLYPKMKVGDQLIYLAQLHGMSPKAAKVSMEQWTEQLGIASRRSDIVQSLSLGNQQRVQLAAALVHNPEILILDEPFSGLDPVAVDVMSKVLIDRANEGAPVIFSSHQLELVERLSTKVGIIQSGQIIAQGTVLELRSRGEDRWRLRFSEPRVAGHAWFGGLSGVTKTMETLTELEFAVNTPGAEQAVLAAAQSAGTIENFGRYLAPLSELFRHAVTETVEEN